MADILLAAGQLICVIGLAYGFILVMIHTDCVDSISRQHDPLPGDNGLQIKPVRDDSAPRSRAAFDSRVRGHGKTRVLHVD